MKAVGKKIGLVRTYAVRAGVGARRHVALSRRRLSLSLRVALSLVMSVSILFGGCFESDEGEQFYGKVTVPSAQEFRWSDGGLPRVFDPARAATPPDTDAVRALFEGLTDYEPGTLRPVPAAASRWESAEDGRKWTFYLRTNALWSNGDPVTAEDFVRSWQRTLRLGERAPHVRLLANIEGAQVLSAANVFNAQSGAAITAARGTTGEESVEISARAQSLNGEISTRSQSSPAGSSASQSSAQSSSAPSQPKSANAFGVVALDAHTLRVTLRRPDKNFPALVAHPVFRPVHELSPGADLQELQDEQRQDGGALGELGIVTNGAFSLSHLAGDRVELKRAASYWDVASVKLERVLFVDRGDTESALAAYRAGELDAVTNASVAPVAVKLLTPYKDFQRGTFAALNYYSFNTSRPPFDDQRVREALACALDTERLSADTLGGATEPARSFLPPLGKEDEGANAEHEGDDVKDETEGGAGKLEHNVERARRLLDEAGYPNGVNFPRIRLLVNRNEQQRQVAQAVARMWREALGVETEIVVRPWEEYEAMLRAGDYDVVRRSLVMQTTDEETNMLALFGDEQTPEADTADANVVAATPAPAATPSGESVGGESEAEARRAQPVLTETQALRELPAIPLHFASSYALVKPYVEGFESNLLDAPSLKNVSINNAWQPPAQAMPSRPARP
jgi:oligopeptide transport system substrate-binding protein